MSQIVHLICLALSDYLQVKMIDEIDDETKVSLVQPYISKDDPNNYPKILSVLPGNPEDPNFRDGRIGSRDVEDFGLNLPPQEVGGGTLWWRRGRVKIDAFFVTGNVAQVDAADYAHTIQGRAAMAIDTCPVAGLIDDFGERAYWIWVTGSTFFESGGPPNQYIWRGTILWQALTQRPI